MNILSQNWIELRVATRPHPFSAPNILFSHSPFFDAHSHRTQKPILIKFVDSFCFGFLLRIWIPNWTFSTQPDKYRSGIVSYVCVFLKNGYVLHFRYVTFKYIISSIQWNPTIWLDEKYTLSPRNNKWFYWIKSIVKQVQMAMLHKNIEI